MRNAICFLTMLLAFTLSSQAVNGRGDVGHITGDVNGDNEVNVSDVTALIDMLMVGDTDLVGDINGDQDVNIADVNALIDRILEGQVDPHNSGYWLLGLDKNGQPVWWDLNPYFDYGYSTAISLEDPIFGEPWNPNTDEGDFVPFYIVIDGVMYGAEHDNQEAMIGTLLDNPLIPSYNSYVVPAGYIYVVGVAFVEGNKYFYVAQAGYVSN